MLPHRSYQTESEKRLGVKSNGTTALGGWSYQLAPVTVWGTFNENLNHFTELLQNISNFRKVWDEYKDWKVWGKLWARNSGQQTSPIWGKSLNFKIIFSQLQCRQCSRRRRGQNQKVLQPGRPQNYKLAFLLINIFISFDILTNQIYTYFVMIH